MQDLAEFQDRPFAPDERAVREQLTRILESPDFNVPARLRGFLSFVVDEALAGRGARLKAFSIATKVLGRAEDFDNVNDPVVRIEAGRLRRALERYYLLAGSDDLVLIDVPKGAYAPRFSWRGEPAASPPSSVDEVSSIAETAQPVTPPRPQGSLSWKAGLAFAAAVAAIMALLIGLYNLGSSAPATTRTPEVVLTVTPFASLSGEQSAVYAAGISDELLYQLARFRELRVMRREAAALGRTEEGAGARYRLEGSVRTVGQHLRVSARLVAEPSAQIVWSEVYDRSIERGESFETESGIAAKVAMAVAQPYGVIFSPVSQAAATRVPDSKEAYVCVLRYYQYRKTLGREEHSSTRDCLERTTSRFPSYSTGWAMLSQLYLDEDRYDLNRRVAPPARQRAREAADRAIQLDPGNVRGLQALMTALFFGGEPEKALRVGERALALNPNDSEMLAELGSRIAQAGDWQRGGAMMEAALERNPAQTSYYTGLIAQGYYMLGRNEHALAMIRRADLDRFSIYHFVAALIFARAGLESETRASVARFSSMRPGFFEDFDAQLAMRNFNARDRAILTEGALQAGFRFERCGRSDKAQLSASDRLC